MRGDAKQARRARRWGLGGASALAVAISCRDPSQITLVARTNVPYRSSVAVAIWTSTSARFAVGGEPQAQTSDPWLDDGSIGDLVVTPLGGSDETLSVRVVMGVGRDPKTCSDVDAKGCIVAKRSLSFVRHTRLRVPVVLHLACEGVVCDGDSTCNYLGRCVPSKLDPASCSSAAGCELAGDETVVGVVTPVGSDGGGEAAPGAVCTPGAREACYGGAPGTLGVGPCRAGERTCGAAGQWGACEGEVRPKPESCAAPGIDADCNGIAAACHIYLSDANNNNLLRFTLNDTGAIKEWGPIPSLSDMALDRASMTMYFTQSAPNVQVSRLALNQSGAKVEKLFDGQQDPLQGIALDIPGGRLFYGEYYRGLYRAPLNDAGAPSVLVSSLQLAPANGVGLGVEHDAARGHIYFTTRQNGAGNTAGRKIWRVDEGGGNLVALRQLQNSECLAIDPARGFMYFVDSPTEPEPVTIHRAKLDGSEVVVASPTPVSCRSMAVRPSDGSLYIVDGLSGRGVLRTGQFSGAVGGGLSEVFPALPTLDARAVHLDLPD